MKRTEPGPGQESVWDYPRPPKVEPTDELVRVEFAGKEIARTARALRVLETSHPPTYYIPKSDFDTSVLAPNPARSICEFKGQAVYYDIRVGECVAPASAWEYPKPRPGFEALEDHLALYPARMDACYVDDEAVTPQTGDFYGGWITSRVVGPFKGGVGTRGW
jgi:uncharacterized protein (DUF427 family)